MPNEFEVFDIGPLTWVKGEIDQALDRAKAALETAASAADATQVKFARTHLHQVQGALAIVGLDGVTRFAEAAEAYFAVLEGGEGAPGGEHLDLALKAIEAIRHYLDGLLDGAPDQPLKLLPLYQALAAARGVPAAATELFFPDLTKRPPKRASALVPPDPGAALRAARARYQRGLLGWIRGQGMAQNVGAADMRDAVRAIEAMQDTPVTRTFWWVALGFLAALAEGDLPKDAETNGLLTRIDQQIKRLIEGSRTVAERLQRDVLYALTRASDKAPEAKAARALYNLDDASLRDIDTPAPETGTLRRAKEAVAEAEEAWGKFCAGHSAALAVFRDKASLFAQTVEGLAQTDYRRLAQAIQAGARWLVDEPARHSEPLAMEMATALLLADVAQENYARLGSDFAHQVDVTVARLHACMAGTPPAEGAEVPELDEMSRLAQEKLLLSQVAREMQSNLLQIEQTLDTFFRDPGHRADLPGVQPLIKQVAGALAMLGQLSAVRAINECGTTVAGFAASEAPPDPATCEQVAGTLSALGFFIDTLPRELARQDSGSKKRKGGPDFDTFVQGLGPRQAMPADAEPATVEEEIALQTKETQALLDAVKAQPEDESLRQELKQNLKSLQKDADLVADVALGQQAQAVLTALDGLTPPPAENTPSDDSAGVTWDPTVSLISLEAANFAPAPAAPSAATLKLLSASDEEIDAELLDIFLEEAKEVLATYREQLDTLHREPGNVEVLTVIRRNVHTLKGSGRMVGLKDFGETAWSIEQVLNLWLRQEHPVGATLFDLLEQAHTLFAEWVRHLDAHDHMAPDPADLMAFAEAMRQQGPACTGAPLAAAPEEAPAAPVADSADTSPLETTAPAPEMTIELPELDMAMDAAEPPATAAASDTPAAAEGGAYGPPPTQTLTISPTLYQIFLEEAQSHLQVLRQGMDHLLAHPADGLPGGIERAAHTLGGIAGTLGLTSINRLGIALEHALLRRSHAAQPDDPTALATLAGAVAALEEMVARVADHTPPPARPELEMAVDELYSLSASRVGPVSLEGYAALDSDVADFRSEVAGPSSAAAPVDPFDQPELEVDAGLELDLDMDLGDLGADLPPLAAAGEPSTEPDPAAGEAPAADETSATPDSGEPAATVQPLECPPRVAALDGIDETTEITRPGGAPSGRISAAPVPAAPPAAEVAAALLPPDTPDQDLLPIFLEEAQELVAAIATELRHWRQSPADPERQNALFRLLHTLKGSARMAGAFSLGELTHGLESRVELAAGITPVAPAYLDELEGAFDLIAQQVERIASGAPGETVAPPVYRQPPQGAAVAPAAPATPSASADAMPIEALPATPAEAAPAAATTPTPGAPGTDGAAVDESEERRREPRAPAKAGEADTDAAGRSTLRVRADLVDRLVNEAGEIAIARSRIEGEMRALKGSLLDLTENVIRLRRQLREIEIQAETQIQANQVVSDASKPDFDPLELDRFTRFQELTRMMAESVNDVATVQQSLLKNLDDANSALNAQSRLTRELQQALLTVRMVPFGSQADRLYRLVRQTARELDKKAALDIQGAQVELDRGVLERMLAPLEHMLRNAVAHGLETPAERIALGKPETGQLTLKVTQEGNEIHITLSDDGPGINLARVREKALAAGLIAPAEADDPQRLVACIFEPGFSTASEVSRVAGRGVGMDVVKTEVETLGGRVEVASEAGRGSRFNIYLPLTLAVTQALLVRVGTRRYAIPSAMIEQVQELKAEVFARIREAGHTSWLDNDYPYHFLPHLLGEREALPEPHRLNWLLLLKSGAQRIALQVDELAGNQEIVVKNVGPQLARVVGIDGATVLGDGEIVLILNPVALALQAANRPLAAAAPAVAVAGEAPATVAAPAAASSATLPTVMVVDDSMTVRKITGRLMAREGYHVLTAKDGVDALEQMLDVIPDVLLVDIEMPRMDGFDLTRNVRADERLRDIPIIMITSRTADKHRNHAFELGVNHYLGKPYQEEELTRLVAESVAQHRR
ncbi:pili chemotaxis protein similar [Oryzomicrobium terrae]|uniref:Chemotaxis protein CheA n=1 Tax=Oryzomicrobium terrae TaxID=1735038 RepID=A0A5C1ECX2_9RHOO|nr:Hpt domain-containing protein [Oryzomicrobium terrae]QEL66459.1 pili chemotaxis protein similar [Oryzomicrobium terrae]